ncbi:MAG: T9SS type A sorting domain-containing protein [Bacteroidota bacterium]
MFLRIFIATVIIIFSFSRAYSQTWNGGTGDWEVAANWIPANVPGAGDDVVISAGTVTITAGNVTIDQLTMSGGTINTGIFTLAARDDVRMTGGTIQGAAVDFAVGNGNDVDLDGTVNILTTDVILSGLDVDLDGTITIGNASATGTIQITNRSDNGGDTDVWTGTQVFHGNTTLTYTGNNGSAGEDWIIGGAANDDFDFNGNLIINQNAPNRNGDLRLLNVDNTSMAITGNLEINSAQDSDIYFNLNNNANALTTVAGTLGGTHANGSLVLNQLTVGMAGSGVNFQVDYFEAQGSTFLGDFSIIETGGNEGDAEAGGSRDIILTETDILGSNITLSAQDVEIDGVLTIGSSTAPGTISITNRSDNGGSDDTWTGTQQYFGDVTLTYTGPNNSAGLDWIIGGAANDDFDFNGNLTINQNAQNANGDLRFANVNNTNITITGNLEINSAQDSDIYFNLNNNANAITNVAGTLGGTHANGSLVLNQLTVGTAGAGVNFQVDYFEAQGSTFLSDFSIAETGGNEGDAEAGGSRDIILTDTDVLGSNITLNAQDVEIDGTITIGSSASPGVISITNNSDNAGSDDTWTGTQQYFGDVTLTNEGTVTNAGLDWIIGGAANDDFDFNGNLTINQNSANPNGDIFLANVDDTNIAISGNLELNSAQDSDIYFNLDNNANAITTIAGTLGGTHTDGSLVLNQFTVGTAGAGVNFQIDYFEAQGSTFLGDFSIIETGGNEGDAEAGGSRDIILTETDILGSNITLNAQDVEIDGTITIGSSASPGIISIINRSDNDGSDDIWTGTQQYFGDVTLTYEGLVGSAGTDWIIGGAVNDDFDFNGNLTINQNAQNFNGDIRLADVDNTSITVSGNLELNSDEDSDIYFNLNNNSNAITTVAGTLGGTHSNGSLVLNELTVGTAGAGVNFQIDYFEAQGSTFLGDFSIVETGGAEGDGEAGGSRDIILTETNILGSNITLNAQDVDIDGTITLGSSATPGTITITADSDNDGTTRTWTGAQNFFGNTTIVYNGNGGQDLNIGGNAGDSFTFHQNVTFVQSVTNGNGQLYPANSGTTSFPANITTTATNFPVTFGQSGGDVLINGNTSQSLNGSTNALAPIFNNLEMTTSGTLTLNADMQIGNVLTFTDGMIIAEEANADANDILIFNDNATAVDANDNSHVDGYIRKCGNDAFTFPTGDQGLYLPIGIEAQGDANACFDTRFILTNPSTDGYDVFLTDGTIEYASACDYYELEGTASVNVTLYWRDYNGVCSGVTPGQEGGVRVARWDGAEWDNMGGAGVASAAVTPTDGFVTSTVSYQVAFGNTPYTLSTTTRLNPLPIVLSRFEANWKEEGYVQILWETTEEINHDYFVIERSLDGFEFEEIYTLKSEEGDSKTLRSYETKDKQPSPEWNYYRLRSVDLDGSQTFSKVEAVRVPLTQKQETLLMPNPSRVGESVFVVFPQPQSEVTWQVITTNGQIIQTGEIRNTVQNRYRLNFPELPSGVYLLLLKTPESQEVLRLMRW